MKMHEVRTYKSAEHLPRVDQLAWKIAEVAADPVPVEAEVAGMIINRVIDNAAVAAASIARRPVASARAQALCHPYAPGATVFGMPETTRVSPEWAAWANGTAVRELDFHDTFLAADYSHPGDNIPPILAVAQHCRLSGADLIRGLATGYEIQVDLVKGICPARTQDRPYRPSRAVGGGGSEHHAEPACRGDLSGDPAGAARHDHHAPEPQGRDFQLESLCAGLCRQDGDRGRGSRDARRGARQVRHGKARTASSHGCCPVRRPFITCRCRKRERRNAGSWRPTPRSIRPSIKARR